MYALSTMAMNHRALFVDPSGAGAPSFERERELAYDGVFQDEADLRAVSRQILTSLDLDGAYGVTRRKEGAIVITRNDLLAPRRLTFTPSTVGCDREEAHRPTRSRRFTGGGVMRPAIARPVWACSGHGHRRHGLLVLSRRDVVDMKVTAFGALALASGAGLFAFFLLTI